MISLLESYMSGKLTEKEILVFKKIKKYFIYVVFVVIQEIDLKISTTIDEILIDHH